MSNQSIIKNPRRIFSQSGSGGSSGTINSIVAGTNITVDNTDPANPIVASTATKITVVANYSALPAANTVSGKFYWCSASQGTAWLPGSLGGTYYNSGLYYSNGTTWEFLNVPYNATQAEVNTGTNDDKFITPNTLTNATVITNKAPLASPTFTGTPLAPNASFGTNTTQLATTAFVQAAMLPLQPIFSGKRRTTLKIAIGVSGGFQGKIYYTPYFTCKQHVVTKIGINVTIASAATNCKFALYADDGGGQPTGSALDFSGDISTATTGFKEYTFTGTRTLTDPVYWMAFQGQVGVTFEFVSSGPVVLEANGSIGFSQNQSYGSFPTVSGLTTQAQPTNVYMIPQ